MRELDGDRDEKINIIGITGGIGSGKTVATDALAACGFIVIDADEVSRALFARGTDGEKKLLSLFPEAVKNGALDRKALRKIISESDAARKKLNGATHGIIAAEIMRRLAASPRPVILSAPLLFETALARLCDRTICIYCPRRLRIARISKRDGISESDAAAVIDAQIPDTERCTLADYIVPSDVDRDIFVREVTALVRRLTQNTAE